MSNKYIPRCDEGLIPNPDTITGCKPECIRDPDCDYGYVCENQKCVEKPDPCDPSPCGPGATCSVDAGGNAICRYLSNINLLLIIHQITYLLS